MPRLAIVIPSLGGVERLEQTLVSVLEQRPAACEIIVVLNHVYADPYHLQDEVRFVQARRGAGMVECANLGLAACQSSFVHLLASGVTVTEGWADAALNPFFADVRIAAVAPVAIVMGREGSVTPLAVNYGSGGSPGVAKTMKDPAQSVPILGPRNLAAFYRRSALERVGGLSKAVGDELADVDLALTLRAAGFLAVCEPSSRVIVAGASTRSQGGFRRGLYAERLFWRNIPVAGGWGPALLKHPLAVVSESVRSLPRPGAVTQWLGRLLGFCRVGDHCRRHDELRQLAQAAHGGTSPKPAGHFRVDAAHGAPSAVVANQNLNQKAPAAASSSSVFSG